MLYANYTSNPGMSGGPIIMGGRVVGVNKGSEAGTRLAVSVLGVHTMLEDWTGGKKKKRAAPVHVAPACAGSGEGSDHFGSIVRSLSLHFCKRLFPGLEPVTSWSQGSSFTTAPSICQGGAETKTIAEMLEMLERPGY
ncbi:hypothetical protein ACQJBY_066065 [Aegilops geniculata]